MINILLMRIMMCYVDDADTDADNVDDNMYDDNDTDYENNMRM